MTVILIDARYFGTQLRRARRSARLSRFEFAQMLKISRYDLDKYESGRLVIPESILYRLMSYGIMMLKARNFDNRK